MAQSKYLSGKRIEPTRIGAGLTVTQLVDGTFQAYNAARLREACHLLTKKMLEDDVTIGLTMTGALTPAGLGMSSVIPLIEAGFVDWIISTGANLYHDTHFGIGLELRQGSPQISDPVLREEEVVRIYDIFFDYSVLLDTDAFFRTIIASPEFQRPMSTAEFHFLCGKYVAAREAELGHGRKSLLAAAWEYSVPIYTSSPGDSSIGMNVAAKALQGNLLTFDVNADVNETASIVLDAKRGGGKIGPDKPPDAVVCYLDSTVALPILTAYAFDNHAPRTPKRLYDRREEMMQRIRDEYEKSERNEATQESARDHAAHSGHMLERDR